MARDLALRLPDRGVNRGKDVSYPAEEEEPENTGQDEEADSRENPSLNELSEPRDEEANQRGDHIPGRTLAHIGMIRR
jgi:hypothetical protein